MRRLLLLVAVAAALVVAAASPARVSAPAKVCSASYVHARLSGGDKCLRAGEYCRIKGAREYHRYHFNCHPGRLSRAATGGNKPAPGCEPGYSPCLPRVADLNCSDIPATKKPIRVTGSDPYRLDGDRDGI